MAVEIHEDFPAFAHAATIAACRRWSRYIEADDTFQELVIYYLRNKASVDDLIEPAPDEGDEEPSKATVRAAHKRLDRRLAKAAERYARKQKAQADGYETGDEYFYSRGVIEALLPLTYGDIDPALVPTQNPYAARRGPHMLNEGNNLPAMVADVGKAVSTLDKEQQDLLAAVFEPIGDGPPPHREDVARHLGISRWALDGRIERLVNQLVRRLGGWNPWEPQGGRRIVGNAEAARITRRQETGT